MPCASPFPSASPSVVVSSSALRRSRCRRAVDVCRSQVTQFVVITRSRATRVADVAAVLEIRERVVATVTLDRPELRTDSAPRHAPWPSAREQAAEDPAVRVIVVTGPGTVLLGGGTVGRHVRAAGQDSFVGRVRPAGPPASRAHGCEGDGGAVQGHVAAGGNGIVASCDLASRSAEAGPPSARCGWACSGGDLLPCLAVMHRRDAQGLLLSGTAVDADSRAECGSPHQQWSRPTGWTRRWERSRHDRLAGPEGVRTTRNCCAGCPSLTRDEGFEWTRRCPPGSSPPQRDRRAWAPSSGSAHAPGWPIERRGADHERSPPGPPALEADLGAPQMVAATPNGHRKICPCSAARSPASG